MERARRRSVGAQPVDVTTTLGGTAEQFFSTPLVVEEGDEVTIGMVVDAIHMSEITASNGGDTLVFGSYFPAFVFPTVGAPGVPQYYTSAGTAHSYNDSLVLANIMRVYYEAGGAPSYAIFHQRAGELSNCTAGAIGIGAYPPDPEQVTPYGDGSRPGGWLGLDDGGTLCWAYGADKAFEAYANYLTMDPVDTVGAETVIHCEQTDAPTPPSSGSNYDSGCPAIVDEHSSANLTLVAD